MNKNPSKNRTKNSLPVNLINNKKTSITNSGGKGKGKGAHIFEKTSKNDVVSLSYYLILLALPLFLCSSLFGANLLAYANNSGGSILTTMFSNMDSDTFLGYYGIGVNEAGKFYDSIYKWLLTPVTSNSFNEILQGNYTNASFVEKNGLGLYLAILINTIMYIPLAISWFVILYKLFELMNFGNIWSIVFFVLAVLFIAAILNLFVAGASTITLMLEFIFIKKPFKILDIWKANKLSLLILLLSLFSVGAFLYLELIVAIVSILIFGGMSYYSFESIFSN